MPTARCLGIVQLLLISGCATEPVQIDPPPLPNPPAEAMRECPKGLVKAEDGTIQSILEARSQTARRYAECRERRKALQEYIDGIRG